MSDKDGFVNCMIKTTEDFSKIKNEISFSIEYFTKKFG